MALILRKNILFTIVLFLNFIAGYGQIRAFGIDGPKEVEVGSTVTYRGFIVKEDGSMDYEYETGNTYWDPIFDYDDSDSQEIATKTNRTCTVTFTGSGRFEIVYEVVYNGKQYDINLTGIDVKKPAPKIQATSDGILPLGGTVTLTIANDNYDGYQWYVMNGSEEVPRQGANSNSFTTSNVGKYFVKVTKDGEEYTSYKKEIYKLEDVTNRNSFISYDVQVEGIINYTQLMNSSYEECQKTIQYTDGLGRPIQTIKKNYSPSLKDFVQAIKYNESGQTPVEYLPYTIDNDGYFDMYALDNLESYEESNQNLFYQDLFQKEGDVYAHKETVYEKSPLSRVLEQGNTGQSWQLAEEGNLFVGATIKRAYEFNNEAEVVHFDIEDGAYVNAGYYSANELYKIVVKNENWYDNTPLVEDKYDYLHTTEEFKNKEGEIILKRTYVEGSNNDVVPVETYYVYDDFGLLRFVIPPKAVYNLLHPGADYSENSTAVWITKDESLNEAESGVEAYLVDNNATLNLEPGFSFAATSASGLSISSVSLSDDLIYSYKYDGRKRMIEKKIPGAVPVYLVYDARDRLVATQDGERRKDGEWLFTKYDALNRPVMTGVIDNNITDQKNMQNMVDDFYDDTSNAYFESLDSDIVHGYTNNSFPDIADKNDYLTVTYYDTYGFDDQREFSDTYNVSDQTVYCEEVKGMVTGTKVQVLDDYMLIANAQWLTTTMYYDDRYRVIQTLADLYSPSNTGGNYTVVSTNYDFVGKVENTLQLQVFESESTTIEERFEYDHAGRLLRTYHDYDGNGEILLVENTYDELGQLDVKAVDNNQQIMDYDYNIRGWLTSINNDHLTGVDDNHKFAMKLHYNTSPTGLSATPQYNGNISAMEWRTESQDDISSDLSAYLYEYDALNRLTAANYAQGASTLSLSSAFDVAVGHYDLNGNIKSLTRRKNGTLIDNLDYTYTGNQLSLVNDLANNAAGFSEADASGGAYSYDLNGNMIQDANRGLSSVTYNHLNLPRKLTGTDNKTITYIYDANGQKLAKKYNGSSATNTYYAGSFIYEGFSLKSVLTAEGMVNVEGSTPSYQYYLKDHLGNTRVMTSGTSTNQIKWYYPFGMTALDYNASGLNNKYLYNGKEWQGDAIGNGQLDWYDYHARQYMADLGRFTTIDPMAEEVYGINPYNYCFNNPIKFIDPTGMMGELASTYVDETGKVIHHEDDGDPNVYLVTDVDAWNKGGRKKDGLPIVGWEDPNKDYEEGDQYTYYNPREDPNYNGQYMIPASAYDYSIAEIDGKWGEDWAYYIYGGPWYSIGKRWRELLWRDLSSDSNRGVVLEAGVEVALVGAGGKATGWISRKVFRSLPPSLQKKFVSAIGKGVVAPKGQQGVIKLTASEIADKGLVGYTHKLKILGKGGDLRIYGRMGDNGHIVFDKIMGH